MMVYGDPALLALRLARIRGSLAQQEFKAAFNDSGVIVWNLTEPLNTTTLMEIFSLTHTNSFTSTVCDCVVTPTNFGCGQLNKYRYFVDILVASQKSTAHPGMRFWLGLFPPSESVLADCLPPSDDPRTHVNESAIFGNRGYASYDAWALLAGLLAQQFPQFVAVRLAFFFMPQMF